MSRRFIPLLVLLCGPSLAGAVPAAAGDAATPAQPVLHTFRKIRLSETFYSEGGTFGDLDGDGAGDVVVGPYWYAGPDFQVRHEIYEPQPFDKGRYSDNFFAFVFDFDGDRRNDVLFIGFPGQDASWYQNPGPDGGRWPRHQVFAGVDNESPTFADLTGDGRPELICQFQDRLGYAVPDWSDPARPWTFHAVTGTGIGGNFTHGLGVGDVNGDGRQDLLMRDGWFEQPESLDGDPPWKKHAFEFAGRGGAQMAVEDFDGDGDADVASSWNAHGFGLNWFEQVRDGDAIAFVRHAIMGEKPEENDHGVVIGNLHALDLVDLDGDGVRDLLVGNRHWAHNGNDPADHEPSLLYWFQTVRHDDGSVSFLPHEVDGDSGVGTQVVGGDVNGDGRPDVVVGNKQGAFVFLNESRPVSREQWADERRRFRTHVAGRNAMKTIQRVGVVPKDDSGRALNLGFETGDLTDWTVEGEAFARMPVEGDTVHPRRADSRSEHQGRFWAGGFERGGDEPQGTLTSAAFAVTHPFASYLVGGGQWDQVRVELLLEESQEVIHTSSGRGRENLEPRFVDLRRYLGKRIFIRLVDRVSHGWGHLNYDDFLFHDDDPRLRERVAGGVERVAGSGFAPEEAARRMTVPEGFRVDLIAGEPDLHQPVAFCIDDRGRVWVAEAHAYPFRREEGDGRDKIVVFADADGDGAFESRTVFMEGLNLISGLEVGFGGVWIGVAPEFQFIPDRDGDLVPDGPPVTLLDGFGYQDTHETLNAFIWGPDGWLYGCHGVFTHSRVGKPGTPDAERVPLNAAVWRYHPTRHEFEVFAWGTSNPWGVDFDDHGQAVITACVIPHLYHVIQGARYIRQAGAHFDPYVFTEIDTIADHVHWLGETPHAGNEVSGAVGGGHAHCGAMIYLGDSFPAEYRNAVFMSNIHGNRVNVDLLARQGSGFLGAHGKDFLLANDPWFRGINLRYGPDGSVFLIDWYDEQACHRRVDELWDRTNGRLYRVSYGGRVGAQVDLGAASDQELVAMQLHPNDWYVRHARRLLMERGATAETRRGLLAILDGNPDVTRRLRALFALHVTGALEPEKTLELLDDAEEYVRAWTIQLALELRTRTPPAGFLQRLAELAQSDPSAVVRLYLASAMQRLPAADRLAVAAGLARHGEDAGDHNLPAMIWYGLEGAVTSDPERALALAAAAELPSLGRFIVRRLASGPDRRLDALVAALDAERDPARLALMLEEMDGALAAAGDVAGPAGWSALSRRLMQDEGLRDRVLSLALTFGDAAAAPYLRERLVDASQDAGRRREALEALVRFRDAGLQSILPGLLADRALRGAAIRALASFDDKQTPERLIALFGDLDEGERLDALSTLTGRVASAAALLDAVAAGRLPRAVLDSATTRRQIALFRDPELDAKMAAAWGRSVLPSEDKQAEIERLKALLTPEYLAVADLPHGRQLFQTHCQICHRLFGLGTAIGPDLTGSNRSDLSYVLANMVDPSGEVGNEYMLAAVTLKDGRVVSGMIAAENEQTLTLRNDKQEERVRRAEIALEGGRPRIVRSAVSLMPEGMTQALAKDELRDLVAYLRCQEQVELRATRDNARSLFDGRTLDNWVADPAIWSVEDGEIVGRTATGLSENSFARSLLLVSDFKLTLDVKLVDDRGNSGIQFRSVPHGEGSMAGYQADVGPGWWGKLYEEHGREILHDVSGERFVKKGEWNRYEIVAEGGRIRTAINGKPCVDLVDDAGAREGVIGLQVHSGGPTEVRFRNLVLEVEPAAGPSGSR